VLAADSKKCPRTDISVRKLMRSIWRHPLAAGFVIIGAKAMGQSNGWCMTMRGYTVVAILGLAFGIPAAVAAQEPAVASSTQAATSDADLANTRCVIGEEKFLPADYYYCLGTQSYGQNKYSAAKRFFTTAASWASKPAQYVLGVMALNGDHQQPDRALALAWFSLASERPDSHFAAAYNDLLKQATPSEIASAQALLAKMLPVYGDATAAKRGQERYEQGMALLKNQTSYCMAGMSDIGHGAATMDSPADGDTCLRVESVQARVDKAAEIVFDGWQGHVTVGPLQQVHQP
jgi:hypothetical protein